MNAPTAEICEERHASGRVLLYVVTCGRFRAELPACTRDECASGELAESLQECTTALDHRRQHAVKGSKSVDAWLRHIRTHCHGYHRGRVQAFAATVSKTYGSHKPLTPARACSPARLGPAGNPAILAGLLGWTVEDVVAELAKAAA